MRSVVTRSITTGDLRLDDRRFGIPGRAIASRPAPRRIYKPRRGLNDISALSKSCHGRNLGSGEHVIWRMSVKRGIRLNVRKGWVFVIPLRGDYGFGDRNGDLVGSRVVAGVHRRVSYVMGGPPLDARKGSAHSRAALGRTCSNAPNCCDLLPFACGGAVPGLVVRTARCPCRQRLGGPERPHHWRGGQHCAPFDARLVCAERG
jgi:hypothetical protein